MNLRAIFTENWPIKLASLILAVAFWFYVTSRGKTEISLTVPLELRNVPQGMAVVGDVPASLEVRLQGQERALRDAASTKRIVGALDLGSAREGENVIHLSPEDIRKPAGVVVTHLAPFEVAVRLDRLTQMVLRLRPVLSGRPALGFRLGKVTVTPPNVTLEGPARIVGSFTSIQTMPVDISGLRETAKVTPRINFQGRPVKVQEQDITLTITIQKERQ